MSELDIPGSVLYHREAGMLGCSAISGGQSYSYKVTPLCNYLLFKVTSSGFVTFKIAVTSNCNGTVIFKSG